MDSADSAVDSADSAADLVDSAGGFGGGFGGRVRLMALMRVVFYKIVFAFVIGFAPVFGEAAAAQEARAQVFRSLGTLHITGLVATSVVDGSLPLSAFIEQLRAVPQEVGAFTDVHEYFALLTPSGNTLRPTSISGGGLRLNINYSAQPGDVMRFFDVLDNRRDFPRLDIFVRIYEQVEGGRLVRYLAAGDGGVHPPSVRQFKTADELEEGEFFLDSSFEPVSVMMEENVGYMPPPDSVTVTTIVQEEIVREITLEVTTTVQNSQVSTVTTTVAGNAMTTTVTMFAEMEVVREIRTTVETVINQEITTVVEVTTTGQTEDVGVTVRTEVIREITATVQNPITLKVTTTVQNLQVSTMTTTVAGDSVTTTLTMIAELEVVREVVRTVETVFTREVTTTLDTVITRDEVAGVPDGQPPPSASDRGSGVIIGGALIGGLMFWLSHGFTTGGFAYTPSFGYSVTESGYYATIGGRLDFRKDRWHLYQAAMHASGDFGEFRYHAGGEYKADFWTAKFSESLRGETEDYHFSLSADWHGGVWRISPTYEVRARRELAFSETQNALYLFGEAHHHRWRIVSSAGFQWRQFGEFGDSARFRLQAVREF